MRTTILELDARVEGQALAHALDDLRHWAGKHRRRITAQWILGPSHVMTIALPEALDDIPPTWRSQEYPRTTRWAVLADVVEGGSSVLGREHSVVVFPHATVEPDPGAVITRLLVLGIGLDGAELLRVKLPQERLRRFRVGKLDHPALLWAIEHDRRYWGRDTDAKLDAIRLVERVEGRRVVEDEA